VEEKGQMNKVWWRYLLVVVFLAEIVAAQQAQVAPQASIPVNSCLESEVHRLDFLVGDWASATSDLTPDSGTHGNGVNHIEASLGGCALIQHRYEEKNGKKLFDSIVIWAFDASTNRLREFVISDDLHAQVYEGIWESDGWVFYRDRIGNADQMWLLRVRYVQNPKGFTQIAELPKDRGKTWTKASSTDYVPRQG
jgi:hypothetical protein